MRQDQKVLQVVYRINSRLANEAMSDADFNKIETLIHSSGISDEGKDILDTLLDNVADLIAQTYDENDEDDFDTVGRRGRTGLGGMM